MWILVLLKYFMESILCQVIDCMHTRICYVVNTFRIIIEFLFVNNSGIQDMAMTHYNLVFWVKQYGVDWQYKFVLQTYSIIIITCLPSFNQEKFMTFSFSSWIIIVTKRETGRILGFYYASTECQQF